jgi:glycerophosphoryl diester phosphodiesterase
VNKYLLFFYFLFLFACSVNKKTAFNKNKLIIPANFDKQGHRGCRGLMPENTIAALQKALDLGMTTLEFDVVITKDGIPILSHEPFFNHEITTKANGQLVTEAEEKSLNIYTLTFAETQKFDVGNKIHPRFLQQQKIAATKPSLNEALIFVKLYCAQKKIPIPFFNIETKTTPATDDVYHPKPAPFVDALLNVVKQNGLLSKTIIQSFDVRTLQYIHTHNTTVQTALLIEDNNKLTIKQQLEDLGFIPNIYSPHFSLVDANVVQYCHTNKIKIIPWTVNDVPTIRTLLQLHVDGIITDYPNLFNQ